MLLKYESKSIKSIGEMLAVIMYLSFLIYSPYSVSFEIKKTFFTFTQLYVV